ncbi:MAG TPA: FMN-binding negative transcriptional regulator [Thermoflexales bacterium]|nr:FMN-binding negative transcriptional regulator [Thermoflexales bacterium]HQW34531.1 FMN-binding negative transcriptional regulator [Thermoflexales bacterium]HQZ22231.1 FMN-binding negative transcriptional regulator [Thermoflexales bacterium]
MYIPKHFEEHDLNTLHALVRARPLGTWVTLAEDGLLVNHIPFDLDPTRGEFGALICHVARANAVWKNFSRATPSVFVFQGPQAYITPSWYATKHETGKAVPTWNYAVVHAYGLPRVMDDREWLLAHVSRLSDLHEATQPVPWRVSDAPPDYIDGMLKAIVGIEIPIAKIEGKWKASQNRPTPDKHGVIAGLSANEDDDSLAMAALVRLHIS